MLWTCLLLPSLALDVFARAQTPDDAAKPFAVTTGGHYPHVVAANAAATAAGVCAGQLVSASLALAPDIVLHDRDPQTEAAALDAVATWATQFTPAVSLAPPDAVLAEIGGSLRLFGGLSRLAARFARGAHDLGYAAQLAFAPTPSAALLLARTGHVAPVRPSRSRRDDASLESLAATLAPLPLAQLDVEPAAVTLLAAAGITTFGQACALPRDALARRVGGAFVNALDRALGKAHDLRPAFVPPPRYVGKLELPAAIENVEALAFAINRLVHELAGWLLGRGLGIVGMSLALSHERQGSQALVALAPMAAHTHERDITSCSETPATTVRFGLAAPAREPAHIVAVLRERLARVVLPAPVVAITLASDETAPLAGRNLGLLPGADVAPSVPLLDRLRARLGEDAVTRVVPRAEHRPELAWTSEAKLDTSSAAPRHAPSAGNIAADPAFRRPLWLLTEPEPLGYALESKPWVVRDGPERIESGWWDGRDVRRDYYIAESPRGETVWIYRDHRYGIDDGEWFLHGVFA